MDKPDLSDDELIIAEQINIMTQILEERMTNLENLMIEIIQGIQENYK